MDVLTYALSKKYTQDTVEGLGALQGANCEIKSIVHQDGANIVTFEWTGTNGTKKTSEMTVLDGTPIYTWTSGNSYAVGDLALYNNNFYQCITANNDVIFNPSKWQAIGSGSTGNYGIVEQYSDLPNTFSSSDRKMYYVIQDGAYYLWQGYAWDIQQPKTITNQEIDALFE